MIRYCGAPRACIDNTSVENGFDNPLIVELPLSLTWVERSIHRESNLWTSLYDLISLCGLREAVLFIYNAESTGILIRMIYDN